MAGPFDNIVKMKERLLSKTPAPPQDDEEDDMPANQPPAPRKQNDFLYDASILAGVVVATLCINGAVGFGLSWWNHCQAQEFYAKHGGRLLGRKIQEQASNYEGGRFLSALALDAYKLEEATQLAQAKVDTPNEKP